MVRDEPYIGKNGGAPDHEPEIPAEHEDGKEGYDQAAFHDGLAETADGAGAPEEFHSGRTGAGS